MAPRAELFYMISIISVLVVSVGASTRESTIEEGETNGIEADRVTAFPGQPAVRFRHYAGYVKVRGSERKALFYWFFEAEDDGNNTGKEKKNSKPLVLWLNGGPGCSSVAYGAANELGPFLVRRKNGHEGEAHLQLNAHSWNKVANMLFVESPVGVGYSYSTNPEDVGKLSDKLAAEDLYAFMLNWFDKFSQFKFNAFFIAGESYAGHYVPQLATLICEHNRNEGEANKGIYIKIQGIMIGNAVLNEVTDSKGVVDFAWSHAIISNRLYYNIYKYCDVESGNYSSGQCRRVVQVFNDVVFSDIDIYSIYTSVCLDKSSGRPIGLLRSLHARNILNKPPFGYDPCAATYIEKYFNRRDVQKALHANVTGLPYPYSGCNKKIIDNWNDSVTSVLSPIRELLKNGLRVCVFSGDTDGIVPVTSTRYSIEKMRLKIKENWRPWFVNQQVAGWVETYEEGLTFASVRGASHQVPVLRPEQALSLFSHFLSHTSLPGKRNV